jgi:N-glycosylase/DNA lyase
MKKELPEPWLSIYREREEAIRARLHDFKHIPREKYFYELIFCVLTPQSSQKNAENVCQLLEKDKFFEKGFDPTSYLRDTKHYIRFHNVKAKRLLVIRDKYDEIYHHLKKDHVNMQTLRDEIIDLVPGFGLKEASHFLRNIGFFGLAILDRHIFKHLIRLSIIKRMPKSLTKKRYLAIEKKWKKFADELGISIDELDLLFWSMETGEIKK